MGPKAKNVHKDSLNCILEYSNSKRGPRCFPPPKRNINAPQIHQMSNKNGKTALMKALNLSRSAGRVQQHIHWTFVYMARLCLTRSGILLFYYSMFVTLMLQEFFSWSQRDGGGVEHAWPLLLFQYSLMRPLRRTLYQIRRPLGLAFVIYFCWLGELLLFYI
jgi:hypothetical protein